MSEPNCPYCGAEVDTTDFFEFDNSTETDYPECGKEFHVEREVEVTYKFTRLECKDGVHDWLDWRPTDIDEATLERWKDDDYFKKEVHKGVYTFFCQNCSSCDKMQFSERFPLGTRLEQSEIKPR